MRQRHFLKLLKNWLTKREKLDKVELDGEDEVSVKILAPRSKLKFADEQF